MFESAWIDSCQTWHREKLGWGLLGGLVGLELDYMGVDSGWIVYRPCYAIVEKIHNYYKIQDF